MSLVIQQLIQLPAATGYGMDKWSLAVGLVMAPQGFVMMIMAGLSAVIAKSRA
ncbi:hypothetical protein [Tomitella biformata]|uniref:hypothetical protein n=1 Tax=Tomitella biformata TaxID=630403 RepID=UPI0004B1FA03|nr:hypothetical protein [Tomitella biformata]